MNSRKIFDYVNHSIAFFLQTGWGAAKSAFAGLLGAKILESDPNSNGYYSEHPISPTEAAKMGAIGGALLGCTTYALISRLANGRCTPMICCSRSTDIIESFGGGMVGYGILNTRGSTEMDITLTVCCFIVGTVILLIPNGCLGFFCEKLFLYLAEINNELEEALVPQDQEIQMNDRELLSYRPEQSIQFEEVLVQHSHALQRNVHNVPAEIVIEEEEEIEEEKREQEKNLPASFSAFTFGNR